MFCSTKSHKMRLSFVAFLILILLSFIVSRTILSVVIIPTTSMEPTIPSGNRVLLNRLSYLFEDPEVGDVIAFYHDEKIYIKRIIGCPLQRVECSNGVVYIDGKAESCVSNKSFYTDDFPSYTLPADCYFVLGDNRSNSDDSRFWSNPCVFTEDIIGKII